MIYESQPFLQVLDNYDNYIVLTSHSSVAINAIWPEEEIASLSDPSAEHKHHTWTLKACIIAVPASTW